MFRPIAVRNRLTTPYSRKVSENLKQCTYLICFVLSLSHRRRNRQKRSKGRRCCLRDGIHSIPCRTTDFAPEWFEEKDNWKNGRLAETDASEKCMFSWSTSHQTTTVPKWIPFFKSSFLRLVRHSIPSPKQQRRPLSSILYVSSPMHYH